MSGETWMIKLRLTDSASASPFEDFDQIFQQHITEANEFYVPLDLCITPQEVYVF